MSQIERSDFLAMHGKTLIENGYNIIPIPPKSKGPGFDGWQKTKSTKSLLAEWLNDGMGDYGIGILTKYTVAVDLDIRDEKIVKKVIDYIEMLLGEAPIRVGNAPKTLLLFGVDEPFRKMKTGKYADEWGDDHEIEVLADGQQFVAFGLHKDTGRPYEWTSEQNPLNTPADDLPKIDQAQIKDIFTYFLGLCAEEGWSKVSNGLSGGARLPDDDDPFADVESVIDLPPDEIRNRLMTIPGSEDYDRWVTIGMALYHQFGGEDEGLAMWHEWSETADNYEPDALEKHWGSFEIGGKKRAPVTARTIIALAKEAATTLAVEKIAELRDAFYAVKDETQWREVCTKVRKAEIDSVARAELADIARKRYNDMTGVKLSIVEVRRAIAYEMPTTERTPKWAHDWVFDAAEDRFFHIKSKITMSIQGFNAVYSRQALTKKDLLEGRTAPSSTPADLVLNIYKVPEIYGRVYAPGKDTLFFDNGLRVGNTYPEYQVPNVPEVLTPRDKRAIATVIKHIAHLLLDEKEQRLFLDWLAWVVQNPGKRVNWAILLQGVEGDGKSFFAFLLRAVMGVSNVRMINANILEGNFNGWAFGQCVIVVEEPRLQGHNKYDVLNRIKPLITNSVIEIHPKGKDPYNVENTCNYFLPTNFRDALPLNDNDRRYCVLFSRWQNRDELRHFVEENPDYYVTLYRTLEECAPALRKWLTEHDVDEDFPAGGDAPRTSAHKYMVEASKPEPIRVVQEIIAEGEYPDITGDLINATSLPDAMIGRDAELPQTQGLNRLLEHNGYVFIGRFFINGKYGRYWSKTPDLFRDGNDVTMMKIRQYILKREKKIEDDSL